jgi:hypothetical protein
VSAKDGAEALAAAESFGHRMKHEVTKAMGADHRETWKCAACPDRVIIITVQPWGKAASITVDGWAALRPCTG